MPRKSTFEDLVPKGENPFDVSVITPNGVAHAGGDGYNQVTNWWTGTDGDKWNRQRGAERPGTYPFNGAAPMYPSNGPKRNRTGE